LVTKQKPAVANKLALVKVNYYYYRVGFSP